jgi:hypothetical protein
MPTAQGAHAWAPFFAIKDKQNAVMPKKFFTYEQQLNSQKNGAKIPFQISFHTIEKLIFFSLLLLYEQEKKRCV